MDGGCPHHNYNDMRAHMMKCLFFCLGCPSFQQRSRKVLLVCFGISPGSRFLHAQQFLIEAMHGSWLFLGNMSPPKKPASGTLDGFN